MSDMYRGSKLFIPYIFQPSVLIVYYTNQVHGVKYILILLKTYLRIFSVQVFRLQGAQHAKFETSCQIRGVISELYLYRCHPVVLINARLHVNV